MRIPFLYQAVAEWRPFAREIAYDLSHYHHRRIAEWHAGPPNGMSSYELLELLEFMDDDGRYKTAWRQHHGGHAWSELRSAVFSTANEVAVLRAGHFPNADSQSYGGRLFIPPHIAAEQAKAEAEAETARGSIYEMADISRQPGYEAAT